MRDDRFQEKLRMETGNLAAGVPAVLSNVGLACPFGSGTGRPFVP